MGRRHDMGWDNLLLPRPMRKLNTSWRRRKAAALGAVLSRQLSSRDPRFAFPLSPSGLRDLSGLLGGGGLAVSAARYKQRILSFACEDVFVRYSRHRGGVRRLGQEYRSWTTMRALGLEGISPPSMLLRQLEGGVVLCTERLEEFPCADDLSPFEHVIPPLVSAAGHAVPGLPATLRRGFEILGHVNAGRLPAGFLPEEEIRSHFERPLRVGFFHGDLHIGNVMRAEDGRTVLIDLKSCEEDRVVALDVLHFVVRHWPEDAGYNRNSRAVRA